MNRFDRAVILLTLLLVIAVAMVHQAITNGPDVGRRPQSVPPVSPDQFTQREGAPSGTLSKEPPVGPGGPSQRVRRPPLQPPSSDDPAFQVDPEDIKSGTVLLGTAYSVSPDGVWLTARHVASDICQKLAIVAEGHVIQTRTVYLDPQMDVAVLRTQGGTPALPIETATPSEGESGYSFGFPTGVLGETQDTLMGRSRMQLSGRLAGTTPTLTWAERRRIPDSLDTLGGMSGGPMFDDEGRVIGTVVAASERRGRVHTVAPEVLSATGRETGLFGRSGSASPLQQIADQSETLPAIAGELSDSARIVKVYCLTR